MSQDQPNEPIRLTAPDNGPMFIAKTDVEAITIAPPPIVRITGNNGQPVVTVHHDGRLEYGPGYQPDEAARQFWDAVEQLSRNIQYGAPLNASINAQLAAGQAAEWKVKRLDEMAQAWADRLPETIRRDTVVEAIHQVTRGDCG